MERKVVPAARVHNVKLTSYMKRSRKQSVCQNISKGVIRRLARRGGVKRISALIYDAIRDVLRLYLNSLVRDSIIFCDYSKRKTVMIEDVVRAVKNRGQILYGFDEKPFPFSKRSSARMPGDTAECSTSPGNSSSQVSSQSSSATPRVSSLDSQISFRRSSRLESNAERAGSSSNTGNTKSSNLQSKKSPPRKGTTRRTTTRDDSDDSDATVESLSILQSRNMPNSNDSMQIISSGDDFV